METITTIYLSVAIVGLWLAYLVAGIIACDRFGRRNENVERLLSKNNACFALTVVFWPAIGLFGYLYFRLIAARTHEK